MRNRSRNYRVFITPLRNRLRRSYRDVARLATSRVDPQVEAAVVELALDDEVLKCYALRVSPQGVRSFSLQYSASFQQT